MGESKNFGKPICPSPTLSKRGWGSRDAHLTGRRTSRDDRTKYFDKPIPAAEVKNDKVDDVIDRRRQARSGNLVESL